MTGYTGWLRTL